MKLLFKMSQRKDDVGLSAGGWGSYQESAIDA